MGAAYPQLFLKRGDLLAKASTQIKIDVNTIGAHEKKGVTVTGPLHEIDPCGQFLLLQATACSALGLYFSLIVYIYFYITTSPSVFRSLFPPSVLQ